LVPTDASAEKERQSTREDAIVRTLSRRLIPFLFLLYVVAYLDRINLGFAALQMQQQLGFNDTIYGFGAGIFFAGYFLFQIPSNLILTRVGARRWIAFLMIMWGTISASMCLVRSVESFYGLRFLLGVAEAGFFPGVIFYLKNWFPSRARARTVARFMTAAPLAGVIGGPLSGALLGLHQKASLAGWQWMFLLEGIPAIVLGAAAWVYLVDHPALATWLSQEQREWLQQTLEKEKAAAKDLSAREVLRVFTLVPVWILTLVYFGLNCVSYGVTLWLPNLIKNLSGVGNFAIGVLSAIPYIAAALTMVVVGIHSDRSGERRWHTAAPALAGAVALALAAHVTSSGPAIFLISVVILGVFSMMGPFWAMPTALLSGTAAATGIALINSVGNLGGFFGPFIIGLVRTSTGGFKGGLLVVAGALGMSAILTLTVKVEEVSRERQPQSPAS
jgi:MFS transporter, ACS family, tartrate transporter